MTPFLLLILYSSILYFGVLKRFTFFQVNGLPPIFIFFVFCTKVVIGVAFGLIYQNYFNGGDTFLYFKDSKLIHDTFLKYPNYYISSLLGLNPELPHERVFTYPSSHLFWKDLGTYVLVHVYAFMRIFTFGYYSLHIFWIALLSLVGNIYFYRVFWNRSTFPPVFLLGILFFMPSIIFWTSGLHKEVFIYLGFGCLLYGLKNFSSYPRAKWLIFGGLLLLGLFRPYLLGICFPLFIAFLILWKQKRFIFLKFSLVNSLIILSGILLSYAIWKGGIFSIFSNKQAEFLAEQGNSDVAILQIHSTNLWEIILTLPEILVQTIIQPVLWECKNIWQYLASLEVIGIFGFVIFVLIKRKFQKFKWDPTLCFILFYALANLLIIGLLVDNTGAIARYRSIPLHTIALLFVHYGYQQTNTDTTHHH